MPVHAVEEQKGLDRRKPQGAGFQPNFRGHIPELYALRALGLCSVLVYHFWPRSRSETVFHVGQLGWIAMDGFFVMSGFLITGILLDSREKATYYSTYFARRAIRILPLYYVVLFLLWAIYKHTDYGNEYRALVSQWGSPAWFTFYLGNFRSAAIGAWPPILGYATLWSLQVEEQYYLLFPFAVAWMKRDHLRRLLIAAVVLSPVFRVILYLWRPDNLLLQYVLLPCHCEGLALGGLIAIRFRSGPWHISKTKLACWTTLILGSTIAWSLIGAWSAVDPARSNLWYRLIGYSLSSAGCAGLVLLLICLRESSYTRWMRFPPLLYLGKISYGVYLLHPIAFWIMLELIKKQYLHFKNDDPLWFAETIALSIILATASWELFEMPLLRLKKRFSYNSKNAPTAISG